MTHFTRAVALLPLALLAEPAAAQLDEPFHFDNAPRWFDIDATIFPLPEANEMAVFDFDSDGDDDLLRVLAAGQSLELCENVGGRWTLLENISLLVSHGMLGTDVKSGDFNGDGLLDIVVAGKQTAFPYPGSVKVFLGNGSGQFQAQTLTTVLPADPFYVQVAVADIDLDSRSDIIAYDFGTGEVTILRATGVQSTHPFQQQVLPPVALASGGPHGRERSSQHAGSLSRVVRDPVAD